MEAGLFGSGVISGVYTISSLFAGWVSSWVAGNCVIGKSSGVAKVLGLRDVGGGLLGITSDVY